jgi:dienelactone hydrolase
MKRTYLLIFIIYLSVLSGFEVEQIQLIFIDEERDNRQIPTEIFYPVESGYRQVREGSFPYIIFGHGWLMNYTYYENMVNEFVPQGWIMAFPRTEEGMFPEQEEFALDLIFLGKQMLVETTVPESQLFGMVDSLAVVMGHSMGGGCSVLAAASSENPYSSIVTFAAAETEPSAIDSAYDILIPSLTFSASEDNITPPATNQMPIYENMDSNYKSYVALLGESHLGITNNAIGYSILNSWLQFVLMNEPVSYFEETLQLHEAQISYLIENNLSDTNQENIPVVDFLLQNYPNPFNPSTTICFYLKDINLEEAINLHIYNSKGQFLCQIPILNYKSGWNQTIWDGKDEAGNLQSSGVYLIELNTGKKKQAKACVLLK